MNHGRYNERNFHLRFLAILQQMQRQQQAANQQQVRNEMNQSQQILPRNYGGNGGHRDVTIKEKKSL
jgi:hypothetical protein